MKGLSEAAAAADEGEVPEMVEVKAELTREL